MSNQYNGILCNVIWDATRNQWMNASAYQEYRGDQTYNYWADSWNGLPTNPTEESNDNVQYDENGKKF